MRFVREFRKRVRERVNCTIRRRVDVRSTCLKYHRTMHRRFATVATQVHLATDLTAWKRALPKLVALAAAACGELLR